MPLAPPMVTCKSIRFTVNELVKMQDADVFGDGRVELIDGRIYRTPAQRVPHMAAMSNTAATLLRLRRPDDWVIFGGTLRIDAHNAPDPDLLWLPCPLATPVELWPDPLVLIEISGSTYRRDSGVKMRLYASHGVPDYWIENLRADRVEVHRDPRNPTGDQDDCHYASVEHFGRGETIDVPGRPGVAIAVDDLLP